MYHFFLNFIQLILNNLTHTIKELIRRNKKLIQNFSYLSALQIFNLLIPLFTYPYLIRVLSKDVYGSLIYAQVLASYFLILVSYGFNTYATKEVSVNRDNTFKINEIIVSIFILKSILFILSLGILIVITTFIPAFQDNILLYFLSLWVCLYDILFPVWYFQGMEKMKYVTYLTLVSRSIFVICIFIFVKYPTHILRVPIINGIGAIISGILAIILIHKKERIRLIVPSRKILIEYLKNSSNFFISELSMKVFGGSNKLIIGTFLGYTELAYYDLAEKIISIFKNIPLSIVRTTIYPVVARTKNLNLVKRTTILMSIYGFICVIGLNVFAPNIVLLIGGEEMLPGLDILRIFSIIIFTTHMSSYYLSVGLWSLNFSRVFRNIMINSSILYLAIYGLFWLFKIINIYTITLTPLIVDLYLLAHTFVFFYTLKLKDTRN